VGIQNTEQQTECGFRLVWGEHPGLRSRWTHGIAALQPGRVVFTPYTLGLRFLTRGEVIINITAVDRGSQHRADRRSIWSLSPSTQVLAVETARAGLEWALLPEVLDGVLDLVDPASR
jgi:hypothetical protein